MTATGSSSSGIKVVATHRKARHTYHVLDRLEAGIVLTGTEVKSVREGHIHLADGYATCDKTGTAWLHGVHIQPYGHGNIHNHEPVRDRKLLLHKREIERLRGQVAAKGLALIPLRAYFKRGRLKIELGLCKGKQAADKREDLKRRTADRETARALASGGRH